MSTEQTTLPEGLQLSRYRVETHDNYDIEECANGYLVYADDAEAAIRAEHSQRLTLQHHAADQAQRIADLERHAASLVAESEAKIPAMQAAFEERLTLDRANRLLVKRIADLETKCDTLKRLHDAAADERDEWKRIASAYSPQKELSTALEQAKVSGRQARKERDDLRARLAEIDAQEPVLEVKKRGCEVGVTYGGCVMAGYGAFPVGSKLYARPVPAQAVPEADAADATIDAAMAAAPEHKA